MRQDSAETQSGESGVLHSQAADMRLTRSESVLLLGALLALATSLASFTTL